MPPINREKADRIFSEFMKRVEEVNADDYYLYRVSKLLLFGSYLNPEQSDYGDIDIAFEIVPNHAVEFVLKEYLWKSCCLNLRTMFRQRLLPGAICKDIQKDDRLSSGKAIVQALADDFRTHYC